MADISIHSYLRPVAPALLQGIPDFGIKFDAHDHIIAKFCGMRKRPFADYTQQSLAMAAKSLNQVLGENLLALMTARNISANALGPVAGLAPNTIGNYLKAASGDREVNPTSGKERSAKLAEVEMLAAALNVEVLSLLTDKDATAAKAQQIAAAAMAAMSAPPMLTGVKGGFQHFTDSSVPGHTGATQKSLLVARKKA